MTDLDKMVETIIEMDKQARKRTEEAEANQRKAQEELESKEKQILSECLEQAEAEVGELVRSEEQAAEKAQRGEGCQRRRRSPDGSVI